MSWFYCYYSKCSSNALEIKNNVISSMAPAWLRLYAVPSVQLKTLRKLALRMHRHKALSASFPARIHENRLQPVTKVVDADDCVDARWDSKRQSNTQEELHFVYEQRLRQKAISVENDKSADDVCNLAQSQELSHRSIRCGFEQIEWAQGAAYHCYDRPQHVLVFD